ncbi:MAG: nuclear transport factor 2 family protein [Methanomicrobiales archaeon]|nr:nuclear transport factor 2 family protein [Methanomicrobiales archaeon]
MNKEKNVEVVKRLFDAFGRGDIPAAMELFDEEIDSKSPVVRTTHTTLTWAHPRRGRQEVMQFFSEMAAKVAPEPFEVVNIIAQGDQVAVEGRNKGTVRSTNKRFEHDWVMIFSLKDGKITRCYHYYDSADILAAF